MCAALLCLNACGGGRAPSGMPASFFATEGPALAVVGEYENMPLEGSMDRTCMLGIGGIALRGENAGGKEFLCTAAMNSAPTEKGRIYGVFQCTGEKRLMFSLRNIGPDQGLGIARDPDNSGMMVFFYHVSREEALRRLPVVKEDIANARRMSMK
jgi:hypothetical protein